MAAVTGAAAETPYRERVQHDFQAWLGTDIWPEAKAAGVSRATFDRALSGVTLDWTLPELEPPGAPVKPPTVEWQARVPQPRPLFQRDGRSHPRRASAARASTRGARRWRAIEARYGVPAEILVAIWAQESGFGAAEAARAGDAGARHRRPSWAGARISSAPS